jgi:hypothetical protein
MIIQLPFSGFYESIHDSGFDEALWNSLFTDYQTGTENNGKLSELVYDKMDWTGAHNEYAKLYTEKFAEKTKINLTFEFLSSP